MEEARETVATTYCVSTGIAGGGFLYGGTFNAAKLIELVFNNGFDPMYQMQIGPKTGEVETLTSYEKFYDVFKKQLEFINRRQREYNLIEIGSVEQMMPQVWRSATIDLSVEILSGYK